ncbi:MAG: penicillin-binding protein activator [Pseudomonadota bacterium]
MQRFLSCWLMVVALYVSTAAHATPDPASGENAGPHIALLLPLNAPAFAEAADAVQRGFLASAAIQQHGLPVRVYPCTDESTEIAALYQQALSKGAKAIAGPLTRNGVSTLIDSTRISVPTLALNAGDGRESGLLYFFGLSAETEARQTARLAIGDGRGSAIIVRSDGPLSKRIAAAFAEEWRSEGGTIAEEITFDNNPSALAQIPPTADKLVFLATDASKARLIRPYLHLSFPVYATSLLFNGNDDVLTNYDLTDIRFADMPWLLQSDHPAVMVYPRANPPLAPEMERLYALGIDAYRLMHILLYGALQYDLPLDGVTGKIRLHRQQFVREGLPAVFRQGRAQLPENAPIVLPNP